MIVNTYKTGAISSTTVLGHCLYIYATNPGGVARSRGELVFPSYYGIDMSSTYLSSHHLLKLPIQHPVPEGATNLHAPIIGTFFMELENLEHQIYATISPRQNLKLVLYKGDN